MDLQARLAALDRIYRIYDEFSRRLAISCKPRCSLCCTPHVTMTTLEGLRIVSYLTSADRVDLFENLRRFQDETRFQPQITTNAIADLCAEGKDPPEEADVTVSGTCPFLTDDLCPIYPSRPFGCRCLVSKHRCHEHGWADVDPFVLSVNTLFLQHIEHLDAKGASGNLTDVIGFLESAANREHYRRSGYDDASGLLIPNRPMKVLMIPPEHRERIMPILEKLRRVYR